MRPVLRVVLYLVLVGSGLFYGQRFLSGYARGFVAAAKRYDAPEAASAPATTGSADVLVGTNGPNAASNPVPAATAAEATNAVALDVTNAPSAEPTNAAAVTGANLTSPASAESARPPRGSRARPTGAELPASGFRTVDALLTLVSVVGLALLVARDVSQYAASRTHRALYNEEGEGIADPEYERAEQVWADGDFLEAIRLLREYLARHPRQLHASLRIAEIYEKDLNNHLAAALEYEEILQCRFDAERWGWAAIHLCNLYNRLNQTEKADALLRRLVEEHGETAAAAKARERLGTAVDQMPAGVVETTAPVEPGGFKLPPGFRPKKR